MTFLRSLIVLLGLLQTMPSFAQELLRNGDFELLSPEGLALDWAGVTWGTNGESAFELVAAGPHGAAAQKIIVTHLPLFRWTGLGQVIPALGAGWYRFEVDLKAEDVLLASVELRLKTEDSPAYGRQRIVLKPGQWTHLTGFAHLTAPATNVFFLIQAHQPGNLLVAGASLKPVRRSELTADEERLRERQFGPELPPVDEAQVLAETDARILRTRAAPLMVQILDHTGKPAANQVVHVEHLRHLFRFGAAFGGNLRPRPNETAADRKNRENFLRLFNATTVGIYWAAYEPRAGDYQQEELLRQIRWLEKQHVTVRGHPVFWNPDGNLPAWLRQIAPPPLAMEHQCDRRLAQLSRTLTPHLSDADVFNELVNWEHIDNPFTRLFVDQGKIETVAAYLREMKRLSPDCLTVINDYDLSPEYYDLLRTLIEAGAPLDMIGQQAHMHGGNWPVAQTWSVLERFRLLKRPVLFTEVSVLSGPLRAIHGTQPVENWETDPENEARQADYLEQFYKLLYSHPGCAGVTLWSYADGNAWLGAPVGVLRKDGTRKPSFDRLDELINRRWRTNGEYRTDGQGQIQIPHAFEGRYLIRCGKQAFEFDHSAAQPLKLVMMQ